MSGLLLTLFLIGSLGAAVFAPIIAAYIFTFVTYMAPKFVLYGPGMAWPWAAISGVTAVILWVLIDRKILSKISFLYCLIVLWLIWINVTTQFAQGDEFHVYYKYNLAVKTIIASLFICLMLTSRIRIEGFIIVIIAAVGFYVGRGFVITLLTGGGGLAVTGETQTPLGDRNAFSTVIWMLIPLIMWLSAHTTIFPRVRIFQLALVGFSFVGIITIVGTQSRGALVAAPFFFAFLFFQSNKKIPIILFGISAIVMVGLLAPQEWWDRMASILLYDEDNSAISRFNSWNFAWNYALQHPIVGGGFRIFTLNIDPVANRWLDAHSIYFEVLGEHGFVGFFLFMSIMIGLLLNGRHIARVCRPYPDLAWAGDLGSKIVVSIVLYMVGGAFLSLAFHPITYDMAALSLALRHLVHREIAKRELPAAERYRSGFRGEVQRRG